MFEWSAHGRELSFSSNANFDDSPFSNTLSIADVTDKSNPVGIANVEYPDEATVIKVGSP